jgi:hypothetical protein
VCRSGGVQPKAEFELIQSKKVEDRNGNHHGLL